MEPLLKEVLEMVRPTEVEKVAEKKLVEELEGRLREKGARPLLVGSLAKGTDLRAGKDMDLFILFDAKTDRKTLESEGLRIGKELFSELGSEYEIDYAEHPYVKGVYQGYVVEIVPCYETKKPLSAVDRTPYHTQYVRGKIRENRRLADEIRLMKQFMKGRRVYGAEAKVQGFSGYLTELLVVFYGSFMYAVKSASSWKLGEVIDPEGLWEDAGALRLFFPDASLVVVDPTDETRNAAAAVSRQRMSEFIVAAAEFLKSPAKEFFFPPPPQVPSAETLSERISSRGTRLIAVVFEHQKVNPNTLFSQLRKTEAALKNSVHDFGFRVMKSGFWTDEKNRSIILFDFEVWELPKTKHHLGPHIDQSSKDQEKFLQKYACFKPYVSEGRWVVDTEREFKRIEDLLPSVLRERRGFGKNLRESANILAVSGGSIVELGGEDFRSFLGDFLPHQGS